ncbi:MAG: DNA alkylation repair protein [Spirochaetales bacterium]|nr:DNA alkylation repair protein [Spirochaetales bacterium]
MTDFSQSFTITTELFQLQDIQYRDFQAKLVPNIPKETIIGVRTPDMRKLAKDLFASSETSVFLQTLPHKYYEENLVHFFMIAMIKDFDECVNAVEKFLPYVDCWPVCDQASPKVFKINHAKLLRYIKEWIASDHVYTARFGLRMLMNEFLDKDFKPEYLELAADKKGEDYYLRMMVAWYFATALAKQYESALLFLEEKRLEPWTHNKAIQKAIESFRVSPEHKEYLRTLKIKER